MLREDIYNIITEDSAAQQAKKQGLVAKGGKWYDKAGKYIAKTIDDKLVKVSNKERQADAQKDKPKLITPNKDALSTWKRKGSDQPQQEPQVQEPPRQMTDYEKETTSTVSRVRDHFTKNEVRNTRYGDAIADHVYGLEDSQGSQAYIETIDEYREIEKSFETPDILKNFTRTDSFMQSGHNMSMLSMMVNHPGQEENDYRYQRMVEYCKQPDADEETCQSFQNTNITDRDKEAFGRMMKNQQEGLRKLGLVNEDNTVTLYRGVKMDNKVDDGKTSYMGSGVDSWTFEPSIARLFGKNRNDNNINILSCRVPLERVIASCFTTSHPKDIRDQNDGSPIRDRNNMEFMHYSEFECVIDSFALEDVSLHNIDNNEDESSWKQKYKELMKEEQTVDLSNVININNEENIDWIRSLEKEEDVNESFILEATGITDYPAIKSDTNKLVYFGTDEKRKKALKANTHTLPTEPVPTASNPNVTTKADQTGKDDKKQRTTGGGADASTTDQPPADTWYRIGQKDAPKTEIDRLIDNLANSGFGVGVVGSTVVSDDPSIQEYINDDKTLQKPPGSETSRYNEVFSIIGTHILFDLYKNNGQVIDKEQLYNIIKKLYGDTPFYKSAKKGIIETTIEASITKMTSIMELVSNNKFDDNTHIAPFWGTSTSLKNQYDWLMNMKGRVGYNIRDAKGNIIEEVPQDFITYKHMTKWSDPQTGKKITKEEINRIRKDNDVWDFMALAAYNGGGGGNPSDTSFIIQNGTDIAFMGFSDKSSLKDQQNNSTPSSTFDNMILYAEYLQSGGYDYDEGVMEKVKKMITKTKKSFSTAEQKLSTIPLLPALFISKIFDDHEDYIMSLIDDDDIANPNSNQKSVIDRNKRIQMFIDAPNKNPNATINIKPGPDKHNVNPKYKDFWKEEVTFANYLTKVGWTEGKEVSRDQATKAWLLFQTDEREVPMIDENGEEYTATVAEAFSTKSDMKIMQKILSLKTEDDDGKKANIIERNNDGYFGDVEDEAFRGVENPLDIYTDLEKYRAESIGHIQKLYSDLNKLSVKDDKGREYKMGDFIAAQNTMDAFHLYMIDEKNAPSLYKYGMIQLVAGTDRITPENMRKCLGVDNIEDLIKNIKVKTPDPSGPKVTIRGQEYYDSQLQRAVVKRDGSENRNLIARNKDGQYMFISKGDSEYTYVDKEDLDEVFDLINDKDKKVKSRNIGGQDIPKTLSPVGIIKGRKSVLFISDEEGNEIPIGSEYYRTKEGNLGKLQTTYDFSSEMQNCLGGKE